MMSAIYRNISTQLNLFLSFLSRRGHEVENNLSSCEVYMANKKIVIIIIKKRKEKTEIQSDIILNNCNLILI